MSEKFHINPETGNPNKCVAKPGNCRFGADTNHYESKDEARTAYESSMSGSTLKKSTAAEIEAARVKACREHDEAAYELMLEQSKAHSRAVAQLRNIAYSSGIRINERTSYKDILEAADKKIDSGIDQFREQSLRDSVARAKEHLTETKRIGDQLKEMDKKYTGWSRFFLVPGGHIHSSRSCRTCNKSFMNPTSFAWMPNLSGKSDEEAVKDQGAYLCTVCFPDAPVSWTNGHDVAAEAKKASQCPGSGTYDYDRSKARLGFYSGNYATCNHCNERITVTKTNKLRGHKPE